MRLQTSVEIPDFGFKIEPDAKVLIMGSCFAENIGQKLCALAGVIKNPFGVIYNPLSIAKCVEILHNGYIFTDKNLEFRDGLWHSFLHHGSFSKPSQNEVLALINREKVTDVDTLILTLGTAYIYSRSGEVVANCHKFPEREFARRLASVDECTEALAKIAATYKNAKIIFTVSPIRHLRDGLAANFLSKSTLRIAIDNLIKAEPQRAFYFPSYEILMDELRDYRFTAEDMCHPTPQATDYIYDIFSKATLAPLSIDIIEQKAKIERQSAHRPLH